MGDEENKNTSSEPKETIWDVYNSLADDRDEALVKEWTDSLNFLLIFASLLAGILTAFVVGSVTLLQPSSQDTTANILMTISNQLANNSSPAYTTPDFEAPVWAIIVNGLLFSALCASLVAVFATVISLQWVRSYQTGLQLADARERALARHFRYRGMNKWRMGMIINTLPIVLNFAVILFLSGLVEWTRNIHPVIYIICLVFTVLLAAFYVGTTLAGIIWASCPYITPISSVRGLLQFKLLLYWAVLKLVQGVVTLMGGSWNAMSQWDAEVKETLRAAWTRWRRQLSNSDEVFNWITKHMELSHGWSRRVKVTLRHMDEQLSLGRECDPVWINFMDGVCNRYETRNGYKLPLDSSKDLAVLKYMAKCWQYPAAMRSRFVYTRARDSIHSRWRPLLMLFGPHTFTAPLTDEEILLVLKMTNWYYSDTPNEHLAMWDDIANGNYGKQIEQYAMDRISSHIMDGKRPAASTKQLDIWLKLADRSIEFNLGGDQHNLSVSLSSSSMHALAFGTTRNDSFWEKDERQYWGRKHAVPTISSMGDKYNFIVRANKVFCHAFADRAASPKATPIIIAKNLYFLSTFLANTPTSNGSPALSKVAEKIPSWLSMEADALSFGYEATACFLFTALSALIWLDKIEDLDDIHHYLAIFLSLRQRPQVTTSAVTNEKPKKVNLSKFLLPSPMPPIWRNWPSREELKWHASDGSLMQSELDDEDVGAILEVKNAQRFTDVILAFDRLITSQTRSDSIHQLTPEEHLVLVQLVIDDARDLNNQELAWYFSSGMKKTLPVINDPALLLVASRVAGVEYAKEYPAIDDAIWKSAAWKEAVKYWALTLQEADGNSSSRLLMGALLNTDSTLRAGLVEASGTNVALQNRIKSSLDSCLRNVSSPQTKVEVISLHYAMRKATWFQEYVQEFDRSQLLIRLCADSSPSREAFLVIYALIPALCSLGEVAKMTNTVARNINTVLPLLSEEDCTEILGKLDEITSSPLVDGSNMAHELMIWAKNTTALINIRHNGIRQTRHATDPSIAMAD